MYRNCTTEETVRRQRQLESCLLEQMLHIPFEQISVSDLCERAGISRKSFYRYFGSKDGCLNALLDHTIIDFAHYPASASQDSCGHPRELLSFLSYWQDRQQLLTVVMSNGLSPRLMDRVIRHALQEERHSLSFLGYAPREYSDDDLIFIVTGLMTLVLKWHLSGYRQPAAQLAAQLHGLLTQPLAGV